MRAIFTLAIALLLANEASAAAPQCKGKDRALVQSNTGVRRGPGLNYPPTSMLEAGTCILVSEASVDGQWVLIEHRRSKVLGWVPATALSEAARERLRGTKVEPKESTSPAEPVAARVEEAAIVQAGSEPVRALAREALRVEVRALALAALPRHALDSDGVAATRRYVVRAVSTGGQFELIAGPIGAFRGRFGYAFVLLSGLEEKDDPEGGSIGGQQHDARLLIGHPIKFGSGRFVPELGYAFALFAVMPSFPEARAPTFVSRHTHSASGGFLLAIDLLDSVILEVEAAAMLGTTIVYPVLLGSAGLSLGVHGSAGVRVDIGGGAGLVARWDVAYSSAPFSGMSELDPTISRATMVSLCNSLSAGVAIGF